MLPAKRPRTASAIMVGPGQLASEATTEIEESYPVMVNPSMAEDVEIL